MELPKEPIPVDNKDPRTLLLYGPPKIGKTAVLAGLKNNFIVDIEDGSEYVEALKKKADNLGELNDICQAVVDAGKPYDFATLDTITELEEWAERSATKKYKNSSRGAGFSGKTIVELDYGLGYRLLRQEFQTWMKAFKNVADRVIYVGHIKDKLIDKGNDEAVSAKDINLTGQLKAIATSKVDAIGYLYQDPEESSKRRLTFFTQEEITCGNRCGHLEGKDFVISEKQDDGTIETYWEKVYQDTLG